MLFLPAVLAAKEAIDSGKIAWSDPVTASEAAAAKGGSQLVGSGGVIGEKQFHSPNSGQSNPGVIVNKLYIGDVWNDKKMINLIVQYIIAFIVIILEIWVLIKKR